MPIVRPADLEQVTPVVFAYARVTKAIRRALDTLAAVEADLGLAGDDEDDFAVVTLLRRAIEAAERDRDYAVEMISTYAEEDSE